MLWEFFESWSKRADAEADAEVETEAEEAEAEAEAGADAKARAQANEEGGRELNDRNRIGVEPHVGAAEDKGAPPLPPPRQLVAPVVYFGTNQNMVECHGPATYQLRTVLKGSLGMTFDGAQERKCWFKRVASETERGAFVRELEVECAKEGVQLRGVSSGNEAAKV